MQRATGFLPREISNRVNLDVIALHAEELAFLWCQRERAVEAPHYFLPDLIAADARVDAHFEGLRVAADAGWASVRASLSSQPVAALFAMACLAFHSGRAERMSEVIALTDGIPEAATAVASALSWLEFDGVAEWIRRLLQSGVATHRRIGLMAISSHRVSAGKALDAALRDGDPSLRAAGLRACAELRAEQVLPLASASLRDDDEHCGFWSAWALVSFGRQEGVEALQRIVLRRGLYALQALEMALRNMSVNEGRRWIRELATNEGFEPLVVIATGVLGDPTAVPWLIERMDHPELGRLAGEAFATITGVDLSRLDLDADDLENEIEDPGDAPPPLPASYAVHLDRPSPEKVARWWLHHRNGFITVARYLNGRPITEANCVDVLRCGRQRQRAGAAIELLRLRPDRLPVKVREKAVRQLHRLTQWTS